VRSLAQRLLESLGFQVHAAADGKQALDLVKQPVADWRLVLLDLTMPQLDGAETLNELRLQGCHLPVLLMSGFSEQEALNRLTGHQRVGFLQKPFTLGSLEQKIRSLIDP
jgi:CheY-like chemotaxis protein